MSLKWGSFATNFTISNVDQNITIFTHTAGGIATVFSNADYDLNESYGYIQVVTAGFQSLASLIVRFEILDEGAEQSLKFEIQNNILSAYSGTYLVVSTPYDSELHKFLRIRRASGAYYFDYSVDATTWVNLGVDAESDPGSFISSAQHLIVNLTVLAGAEAGITGVIFDNFNTIQSPFGAILKRWDNSAWVKADLKVYQEAVTDLLADSYSESNANSNIQIGTSIRSGVGQSFTGDGNNLTSAVFWLKKFNSPTGNVTAKVYSHTGTFGTSSVPDTLLATSEVFDSATLTTSFALIPFSFTGANQITLTNGVNYVLTLEKSIQDDVHTVGAGFDSSSSTHTGNAIVKNSGTWIASGGDVSFYVYTGTASWVNKEFYFWDGSVWVEIDATGV